MAIRPFTPFPPPPLKFRTAGFPQYGFKRTVSSDLHGPRHLYAATVEISPVSGHSVVGLPSKRHSPSLTRLIRPVALGSANGYSVRQPPRLLWPHPSLWPGTPAYELFQSVLPVPELPQFTPRVCWVRVVSRTPAVSTAALDCCFTVDAAFAVFASARQPHRQTFRPWPGQCNEAAEFALCYDPIPLLALHRPGRLRPSFHCGCHHPTASVITKRVSVNSRYRSFTGKTRGLMGCEQRSQNTMRDPKRIAGLLKVLEEFWRGEPDLRLGQLIVVAARYSGRNVVCQEIFYLEDEDMLRGIEELARMKRNAHRPPI